MTKFLNLSLFGQHHGLFLTVTVSLLVIALSALFLSLSAATPTQDLDWQTEWAVQEGFDLTVDSSGFDLPTSIAFVPEPGNSPKDPLYFVSEIQGRIKVVTNDRTILTFADDVFGVGADYQGSRVGGVNGICLDPEHGYLFATIFRPDKNNIPRNGIIRYETTPKTFSLSPKTRIEIGGIFERFAASAAHPIGSCLVNEGLLYVAVGDASTPDRSQRRDSVVGKVLRMELDGSPATENPFYRNDDPAKAENYVWASGLRNPFGLQFVRGSLFTADNGPAVDRFLRLEEGGNYLWDGTNASIGTSADAVIYPSDGVAQMASYPAGSKVFPERFEGGFFLTVSADPGQVYEVAPAIITIFYDFEDEKVRSVPKTILRHRGSGIQVLAGTAFGPDGLYLVPMIPDSTGTSSVLKLQYDPSSQYPFLLEGETNPVVLMSTRGCFACHTLDDNQGGDIGPALDQDQLVPRLEARLNSQEYASQLEYVATLNQEPYISFTDARRRVEQSEGVEKIRLWIQFRIQEPRFDDPNATMPKLGLTEEQASSIAAFLSGVSDATEGEESFFSKIGNGIKGWFPEPTRDNAPVYIVVFFLIGLVSGVIGVGATWKTVQWRRRRARA